VKRVLIISPHFPPVNAADMHRVRQSLPYLRELGWEAEVITVDKADVESYSEDDLLLKSIPNYITIHFINAWDVNKTRKFGIGSLSMRSFVNYRKKGNELLSTGRFDLVFFSTTAFHVLALGPYWKRKFKVPFVIDMQDPWRNDFYLGKPKQEQPPKFWLNYRIDKYLEGRTIPQSDGVISVSTGYCSMLTARYPNANLNCTVIPFGAMKLDYEIMESNIHDCNRVQFNRDRVNIVYVGRAGYDMQFSLSIFFAAIQIGLQKMPDLFNKIQCWFVGTSYAPNGQGTSTVKPVAEAYNVASVVTEITDRLPYFETLFLLSKADILFVPGSIDTSYTASKIYPYVLASKPMLAIFHENSSVVSFIQETNCGECVVFSGSNDDKARLQETVFQKLKCLLRNPEIPHTNWKAFEKFTAFAQTQKQTVFFDKVIEECLL
jgi:glycosyltransferase involved in cell wall biosynthesis